MVIVSYGIVENICNVFFVIERKQSLTPVRIVYILRTHGQTDTHARALLYLSLARVAALNCESTTFVARRSMTFQNDCTAPHTHARPSVCALTHARRYYKFGHSTACLRLFVRTWIVNLCVAFCDLCNLLEMFKCAKKQQQETYFIWLCAIKLQISSVYLTRPYLCRHLYTYVFAHFALVFECFIPLNRSIFACSNLFTNLNSLRKIHTRN